MHAPEAGRRNDAVVIDGRTCGVGAHQGAAGVLTFVASALPRIRTDGTVDRDAAIRRFRPEARGKPTSAEPQPANTKEPATLHPTCPYVVPGVPFGEELDDLEVLERLVADLRGYASGRTPTAAEIEAAPVIERWSTIPDPSSVRLGGLIVGHPRLGDTSGVTSRVYAVDRHGRWMRTYSRLWRLGSRAPANSNDPA